MEKDAAYAKRMEVSASWIEVAAEAEDRSLTKRFLFLGPVAVPVSKQPGSRSLAAHDLDPFPGDVIEVWKKRGEIQKRCFISRWDHTTGDSNTKQRTGRLDLIGLEGVRGEIA